jgi:hypothetical protein
MVPRKIHAFICTLLQTFLLLEPQPPLLPQETLAMAGQDSRGKRPMENLSEEVNQPSQHLRLG